MGADKDEELRHYWLLGLGSAIFIALTVLCTIALTKTISTAPGNEALSLTSIMMVGLALVVGLMILLILFYKITGIADKTQALGLPTGSVRALIAFCLVLMFICLGVFLYHGLSTPGTGGTSHNVTLETANDLEKQFGSVIKEPVPGPCLPTSPPATNSTAKTPFCQLVDKDGKELWNVTYFPNRSKEGDEFAKQLFAQLATVFVTVIGFYFGSSTATAGVASGAVAARGGPAGTTTPTTIPTAGSGPGTTTTVTAPPVGASTGTTTTTTQVTPAPGAPATTAAINSATGTSVATDPSTSASTATSPAALTTPQAVPSGQTPSPTTGTAPVTQNSPDSAPGPIPRQVRVRASDFPVRKIDDLSDVADDDEGNTLQAGA